MDVISALFDAILARIVGLNLFLSVVPALHPDQVPIPSAEVWLAEDKLVEDMPEKTRDLIYQVQITVGYQEDGTVQSVLHPMLDAIRNSFSAWEPDFIGLMPATVPSIKIAGHEDHGKTIYVAQILIRVFPETFQAK